jgi:sulfate adenylyltransferase large subunit
VSASSVLEAPGSFAEFLEQEQAKDLLRFTTAGSVDDGKSTLIGRLLYDSRSVYEDQLESVTKASVGRNAGAIDFSLLTDGLRAEREQGITIDVAYRYFATPKRKFIIADTPGHEQYTRNMVTGASTAELAIVLVDARKGLLPQSRRHAYISSLLGLPHVVFAINKMDLVGYEQKVFDHIETEFRHFLSQFQSIEPYFVPISALVGDNVVTRGKNMPWFHGVSLLEHLENVPVGDRAERAPFRFPVQRVVRPNHQFRGYAGTVASGRVRAGDAVTVLPSGRTTTLTSIATFDGNLPEAHSGQSVTITLKDEIDISRGDMIALSGDLPTTATSIEATLVWLNESPAELDKRYRLKQTTAQHWADLKRINYRLNINTLDREKSDRLEMNAIGAVSIEVARPLAFDPYLKNRATGSFILIDPDTNATVAAGLITGKGSSARRRAGDTSGPRISPVTFGERVVRQGHVGAVVRLAGRQELAWRLERLLFDRGCNVFALDDLSDASLETLLRLGTLVLLTGTQDGRISVTTADGKTDAPANSLPDGDLEAAQEVERMLERIQVLLPTGNWSDSGGI